MSNNNNVLIKELSSLLNPSKFIVFNNFVELNRVSKLSSPKRIYEQLVKNKQIEKLQIDSKNGFHEKNEKSIYQYSLKVNKMADKHNWVIQRNDKLGTFVKFNKTLGKYRTNRDVLHPLYAQSAVECFLELCWKKTKLSPFGSSMAKIAMLEAGYYWHGYTQNIVTFLKHISDNNSTRQQEPTQEPQQKQQNGKKVSKKVYNENENTTTNNNPVSAQEFYQLKSKTEQLEKIIQQLKNGESIENESNEITDYDYDDEGDEESDEINDESKLIVPVVKPSTKKTRTNYFKKLKNQKINN